MKVLVTGGSGLIGRYVVDELHADYDVEILDLKPPHRGHFRYHAADLLDVTSVRKVVEGFDCVVHLAGIPHPLNDPPEKVFRTNALGTYHLLEVCAENEIRRVIFISSESVLGFAFSKTRCWPDYVPIDELHPLRPQDPYGLSKLVDEQLCSGFSRRTGMQTLCLRPPWVWVPQPEEIKMYRQLRDEYRNWSKNLWAYIHVLDVAAAIRKCLEAKNLPLNDSYFICAPETWVELETRKLMSEFYPETRKISPSISGNCSVISCEKARNAFGFSPKYTWRDIIH